MRLNEMKRLLRNTQLTLSEVATRRGFTCLGVRIRFRKSMSSSVFATLYVHVLEP